MPSLVHAALLVAAAAAGPTASAHDLRAELGRLAEEVEALDVGALLYAREGAGHGRGAATLERLLGEDHDAAVLYGLLADPEPRVRTLAAALLFASEEPRHLPALARLAGDEAPTFPRALPTVGMLAGTPPEDRWRFEEQTVGELAQELVGFYLAPAGYHYGVEGYRDQPGFDRYWAERAERAACASWFHVRLLRASGGVLPTPRTARPALRALRAEIDLLPEPDRTWTLCWLAGVTGGDVLVGEDELVALLRGLGPEAVLAMLERRIGSDDPDVQPRRMNDWPYQRMCLFALRHAEELLRPADADRLLAEEGRLLDPERRGTDDPLFSGWWAIGAARLAPARAEPILRAAMARHGELSLRNDRGEIAAALWGLRGAEQRDWLVDWFHGTPPGRARFPHDHAHFLRRVGSDVSGDRDATRALLAALVLDERLAALDWQSLEVLCEVVNGLAEEPVVAPGELRSARHPLGQAHFAWERGRAEAMYPEQTAALLETLDRWRASLRDWARR